MCPFRAAQTCSTMCPILPHFGPFTSLFVQRTETTPYANDLSPFSSLTHPRSLTPSRPPPVRDVVDSAGKEATRPATALQRTPTPGLDSGLQREVGGNAGRIECGAAGVASGSAAIQSGRLSDLHHECLGLSSIFEGLFSSPLLHPHLIRLVLLHSGRPFQTERLRVVGARGRRSSKRCAFRTSTSRTTTSSL